MEFWGLGHIFRFLFSPEFEEEREASFRDTVENGFDWIRGTPGQEEDPDEMQIRFARSEEDLARLSPPRIDITHPVFASHTPQISAYTQPDTIDILNLENVPFPSQRDISRLERVSALTGATGAELVRDQQTGILYVRKYGRTPEHILEELHAMSGYSQLGVRVPPVRGYYDIQTRRPFELSLYIPGVSLGDASSERIHEAIDQIRSDFGAHALLANWDLYNPGEDNFIIDGYGRTWLIDAGSALDYRALGELKTTHGLEFGPYPIELFSLRQQEHPVTQLLGEISYEEVIEQMRTITENNRPENLRNVHPILEARLNTMAWLVETYDTLSSQGYRADQIEQMSQRVISTYAQNYNNTHVEQRLPNTEVVINNFNSNTLIEIGRMPLEEEQRLFLPEELPELQAAGSGLILNTDSVMTGVNPDAYRGHIQLWFNRISNTPEVSNLTDFFEEVFSRHEPGNEVFAEERRFFLNGLRYVDHSSECSVCDYILNFRRIAHLILIEEVSNHNLDTSSLNATSRFFNNNTIRSEYLKSPVNSDQILIRFYPNLRTSGISTLERSSAYEYLPDHNNYNIFAEGYHILIDRSNNQIEISIFHSENSRNPVIGHLPIYRLMSGRNRSVELLNRADDRNVRYQLRPGDTIMVGNYQLVIPSEADLRRTAIPERPVINTIQELRQFLSVNNNLSERQVWDILREIKDDAENQGILFRSSLQPYRSGPMQNGDNPDQIAAYINSRSIIYELERENMTPQHGASTIIDYAQSSRGLNGALLSNSSSLNLEDIPRISGAIAYIEEHPTGPTLTYHLAGWNAEDSDQWSQVGNTITLDAFLSTTRSWGILQEVNSANGNGVFANAIQPNMIVVIQGRTGADISDLSFISEEAETLYAPGSMFEVVVSSQDDNNPNLRWTWVREVVPNETLDFPSPLEDRPIDYLMDIHAITPPLLENVTYTLDTAQISHVSTLIYSASYTPEELISNLRQDAFLAQLFPIPIEVTSASTFSEAPALDTHTLENLSRLERYFSETELPENIDRGFLRLFFAIRDAGRPIAALRRDMENQNRYRSVIISNVLEAFEYSPEQIDLALALSQENPVTLYAREEITLEEASHLIQQRANDHQIAVEELFEYLSISSRVVERTEEVPDDLRQATIPEERTAPLSLTITEEQAVEAFLEILIRTNPRFQNRVRTSDMTSNRSRNFEWKQHLEDEIRRGLRSGEEPDRLLERMIPVLALSLEQLEAASRGPRTRAERAEQRDRTDELERARRSEARRGRR